MIFLSLSLSLFSEKHELLYTNAALSQAYGQTENGWQSFLAVERGATMPLAAMAGAV